MNYCYCTKHSRLRLAQAVDVSYTYPIHVYNQFQNQWILIASFKRQWRLIEQHPSNCASSFSLETNLDHDFPSDKQDLISFCLHTIRESIYCDSAWQITITITKDGGKVGTDRRMILILQRRRVIVSGDGATQEMQFVWFFVSTYLPLYKINCLATRVV